MLIGKTPNLGMFSECGLNNKLKQVVLQTVA